MTHETTPLVTSINDETVANLGADYRLLEVGEIIRAGDEIHVAREVWIQAPGFMVGSIQHYLSRSVRRRI